MVTMILTFKENKCYPLNHLKNHITRPNIMAHLTLTGTRFDFLIYLIHKKGSEKETLVLAHGLYICSAQLTPDPRYSNFPFPLYF